MDDQNILSLDSEEALDEAVFNDPEAGSVPRVRGQLGEPAPERG